MRLLVSRVFGLSLLLSVAQLRRVQAQMFGYSYESDRIKHEISLDYYAPEDRGCALCRNEDNCSLAFHNMSAGVFCGDVLSTFQPCCCSFRNECMTTIFSDSCECFNGFREEEIMTTRFYFFMALSFIAWGLLLYDKMCAGPYKVMNSNHQLLASSPSAARARGEDSVVDTVDSGSEHEVTSTDDDTMTLQVSEEVREIDDNASQWQSQSSTMTDQVVTSADVAVHEKLDGDSSIQIV